MRKGGTELLRLLLSVGVLALAAAASSFKDEPTNRKNENPIMVVDLTKFSESDFPSLFSIQVCAGFFNRDETVAGAAYVVFNQTDLSWLQKIESISDPVYTPRKDFLSKCFQTVAKGRYIHYSHTAQHNILPNLVALAGVLDAVPLVKSQHEMLSRMKGMHMSMIFDAEKEFAGFSDLDTTRYMFENHAHKTTGMAKMDPGYVRAKKTASPKLKKYPVMQLADYVVKERLFNFYLLNGCLPHTKAHSLMEIMTQPNHPNTTHWPKPIAVFGYECESYGSGTGMFEAETNCVSSRNLGAVVSDYAPNLSFFSRKGPITEPLQQNSSPKEVYDESTTYLSLVIGDGDNIGFMRDRNLIWTDQRLSYCKNESMTDNCFPISWTVSPHLLYTGPDILKYYFELGRETGQDFFLLPPSGYLYAYPSQMSDKDQDTFVQKTQEAAILLNTSGTVDWEFTGTWKNAVTHFFPRYAEKSIVRGLFAVNVPFNLPVWEFGRHEFYKILRQKNEDSKNADVTGGGAVVLFRPREWRAVSGKTDIPFDRHNNLTPKDMAHEINGHAKGTVTYIYFTSDGGATLDALYDLVPLLDSHVKVVSHEVATDMALQRSKMKDGNKRTHHLRNQDEIETEAV